MIIVIAHRASRFPPSGGDPVFRASLLKGGWRPLPTCQRGGYRFHGFPSTPASGWNGVRRSLSWTVCTALSFPLASVPFITLTSFFFMVSSFSPPLLLFRFLSHRRSPHRSPSFFHRFWVLYFFLQSPSCAFVYFQVFLWGRLVWHSSGVLKKARAE